MMTNKIDALNMRITELQIITEILKELSDDPTKNAVDICREREINFDRFLHYAGDIVKGDITHIEDLGLTRAYLVLKRAGINTVAELEQLTVSDIMKIPHMGIPSTAEIVDTLEGMGISIPEGQLSQLEKMKLRDARDRRKMTR